MERSATTSVTDGEFTLDFLFASPTCNLGANAFAEGAFFIDVDGDAQCDPARDQLFVWNAFGGPAGTCRELSLSPASPRCAEAPDAAVSEAMLVAAQSVCPAVGACLDFCGADVGAGGVYCPADGGAGGAGGSDAMGGAGAGGAP
jgi:hypothetical protein